MSATIPDDEAIEPAHEVTSPWLLRWWALMDLRIGIAPVPVVVVVIALAAVYVKLGKGPSDIMAAIAFLGVGGFLCAEIGKRPSILRRFGFARGGCRLARSTSRSPDRRRYVSIPRPRP